MSGTSSPKIKVTTSKHVEKVMWSPIFFYKYIELILRFPKFCGKRIQIGRLNGIWRWPCQWGLYLYSFLFLIMSNVSFWFWLFHVFSILIFGFREKYWLGFDSDLAYVLWPRLLESVWISLGWSSTTNHDHGKSWIINAHNPWSHV